MPDLKWISYRLKERFSRWSSDGARASYAQCGEDLIVRFVFDTLRIVAPSFLDIGAHHPRRLNNTYLFYAQGARGVNVEPDPELFNAFVRERPQDCNLNIGIGDTAGTLPFFVMTEPTLNTFSEAEARAIDREGRIRIARTLELPVRTASAVITEHLGRAPDFLSLDVEGLDLAILRSLDFAVHRPKVICVETITYSEQRSGQKIPEIAELMQDNGYFAYADTHINTLFVDRQVW